MHVLTTHCSSRIDAIDVLMLDVLRLLTLGLFRPSRSFHPRRDWRHRRHHRQWQLHGWDKQMMAKMTCLSRVRSQAHHLCRIGQVPRQCQVIRLASTHRFVRSARLRLHSLRTRHSLPHHCQRHLHLSCMLPSRTCHHRCRHRRR